MRCCGHTHGRNRHSGKSSAGFASPRCFAARFSIHDPTDRKGRSFSPAPSPYRRICGQLQLVRRPCAPSSGRIGRTAAIPCGFVANTVQKGRIAASCCFNSGYLRYVIPPAMWLVDALSINRKSVIGELPPESTARAQNIIRGGSGRSRPAARASAKPWLISRWMASSSCIAPMTSLRRASGGRFQ